VEAHPVRTFQSIPIVRRRLSHDQHKSDHVHRNLACGGLVKFGDAGADFARRESHTSAVGGTSLVTAWAEIWAVGGCRWESSASHIRVFWCVHTHRASFSVLPKRLSVCDFFVKLSRSRPTRDPRGRFAIPRLTLILARAVVGPGAFRHPPPSLGSQQFRRKSRPGLGGLQGPGLRQGA
jgi:hypothetical protein